MYSRWHAGSCQEEVRLCYGCNQPGHLVRECPRALLPDEATLLNLSALSIGDTSWGGGGQYMGQTELGPVHRWQSRPFQEEIRICYGCGQPGHLIRECPRALLLDGSTLTLPGPLTGCTIEERREDGNLGQRRREHRGRDQTVVGSCQREVSLCYGCMQPGHLIRDCSKAKLPGRAAPHCLLAPPIAGIGQGGKGGSDHRQRGQGQRRQGCGVRGHTMISRGHNIIDGGSGSTNRGSGPVRGRLAKVSVLTSQDAQACNVMISGSNVSTRGNDDDRRPWSDLPALVLYAIAMRLTSPFAFAAFAGVCSSWRSIAKSGKSDFIASQPPLLLTLPHPTREYTYSLYSLIEDRSYSVESLLPAKFWQPTSASFIKFSYLGYSHGHLIMLNSSAKLEDRPGEILSLTWEAPTLLSPRTGRRIDLKHTTACAVMFLGGLLTAPVTSADCKLMLFDHDNMHCWRISDSSWYMFELPAVTYSAVVHKGRLYLACTLNRVWLMNADHPHEVLRIIEPPTEMVPQLPHLVESDGELLMMSYFNLVPEFGLGPKTILRLDTYQLDLSRGELYARWMRTSGSGPLFIDCWGGRAYIGSGRMKGVEEGLLYRAESRFHNNHGLYHVITTDRNCFYKSSPNAGADRVWVHPGDLQQWGFRF